MPSSNRVLRCCLILFLSAAVDVGAEAPAVLDYEVLRQARHDKSVFTQGLLVQRDWLVETAGGFGSSRILRYDADSGEVVAQSAFPRRVFAEGVTQVKDKLYMLTWRNETLYTLDARSLEPLSETPLPGEGWGIAYDGEHLVKSNGGAELEWLDVDTLETVRAVTVTSPGKTWHNLNELEFAQKLVWANVWQDSRILAIDPAKGQVRGILDLQPLVAANSRRPNHAVLNGIAYDPAETAFWVTGKLWPNRYLIRIKWPETPPPAAGKPPANTGKPSEADTP